MVQSKKRQTKPKKVITKDSQTKKSPRRRYKRWRLFWGALLLFFIIYFAFLKSDPSVKIFGQDGTINVGDITSPDELGLEDQVKKVAPTKCLEPVAGDMIGNLPGWTKTEDVINTNTDEFNYVGFRSPDFETRREGVLAAINKGGEIHFIVNCKSDFKSIEELVAYEEQERYFKDNTQEPVYVKHQGHSGVQYYLGDVSTPPLTTVFYVGGYKFTLQYTYPLYSGDDSELVSDIQDTALNLYFEEYKDLLDSIDFSNLE